MIRPKKKSKIGLFDGLVDAMPERDGRGPMSIVRPKPILRHVLAIRGRPKTVAIMDMDDFVPGFGAAGAQRHRIVGRVSRFRMPGYYVRAIRLKNPFPNAYSYFVWKRGEYSRRIPPGVIPGRSRARIARKGARVSIH